MKYIFLVVLSSIILGSCGETATQQKEKINYHSLIFFDKTQSVNVNNDFVNQKYQTALKNLIDEHIKTEGDQIDIYYIHENTAKAKVVSIVCRTAKEETEGLNATDLEAAETSYQMSIGKEKKMILQLALQKMLEKNSGASNAETNISAAVPLLSEALASKKEVNAYFFSDMIESVKNGRDFHTLAPISHDQAEEWAKKDAENYKLYNLNNTKISMILPFPPSSSSKENNPSVTDYWKTYFESLGANQVKEI
jgi:hypothetical protein